MKILQLTLKKKPFDVMISGEKKKRIQNYKTILEIKII